MICKLRKIVAMVAVDSAREFLRHQVHQKKITYANTFLQIDKASRGVYPIGKSTVLPKVKGAGRPPTNLGAHTAPVCGPTVFRLVR